ncbi:MAG: hypothetical protein QX199_11835 [Methylococcaceae bacterium]
MIHMDRVNADVDGGSKNAGANSVHAVVGEAYATDCIIRHAIHPRWVLLG